MNNLYHISCRNYFYKYNYIVSAKTEEEAIAKVKAYYDETNSEHIYAFALNSIIGVTVSDIFYQVS